MAAILSWPQCVKELGCQQSHYWPYKIGWALSPMTCMCIHILSQPSRYGVPVEKRKWTMLWLFWTTHWILWQISTIIYSVLKNWWPYSVIMCSISTYWLADAYIHVSQFGTRNHINIMDHGSKVPYRGNQNRLLPVTALPIRDHHDDVSKWKHFLHYWPFAWGIHQSPVNSPHKGQWRGALMFSLIFAWINSWVNNREAGDLRRPLGHYDVSVMIRNHTSLISK